MICGVSIDLRYGLYNIQCIQSHVTSFLLYSHIVMEYAISAWGKVNRKWQYGQINRGSRNCTENSLEVGISICMQILICIVFFNFNLQ